MEWNRSETLALAGAKCKLCRGIGMRTLMNETEAPCNCVFRAIFRSCFERFVQCANKNLAESRVSLENGATRDPGGSWSRKNEEYVADFMLVVKRVLTESEQYLFRLHFILGADWRLCVRKLGMDKGNFFHAVYRIQQRVGRELAEMLPYPLYPVRDYFTSTSRDTAYAPVFASTRPKSSSLGNIVPIRKAA